MLSMQQIIGLLKKEALLKEIIIDKRWHYNVPTDYQLDIEHITYDSREVSQSTLFFCKGLMFKEEYLVDACQNGLQVYVSELVYEQVPSNTMGIIVTDIRKAMAIIAMNFYGMPQNELKIIAYTGTKGKTSSAYFCYSILKHVTNNKTALFSTLETFLGDGEHFKSNLTTEEALPLYKMMRQAVDNGMTHLVMEVSSQAYKLNRVYGLVYDVGVFLNISPDHISPIEHPTFDDYFYCKRQLMSHSKQFILNLDSDYSDFLLQECQSNNKEVLTFGENNKQADVSFISRDLHSFAIQPNEWVLEGDYSLRVEGVFNQSNATSALLACSLVTDNQGENARIGLEETVIPGRMEKLMTKQTPVYVDFAHNYLSLDNLLSHVHTSYPNHMIKLVIGSTGDKGVERRMDFGKVINQYVQQVILTSDDPGTENPVNIAETIKEHIDGKVITNVIIDRKEAILYALTHSSEQDVVVIAGKGTDKYQIIGKEKVAYQGDKQIVEEFISKEDVING
ncbi:UDP-N-acetylmuramyl-tripeptide synthetase [Vagococcus xieshaowenii]|uniref:UDP-N-acetylmuramyl-tripeptide synthetase n=1 Tax=Vagococcus xieshaowenii TaxID=2562451 RepID=A0AAJ5EF76_9ENTE|nr:UDP-N-acetylmuramyl-tripeptide synthetase [Vagococcus xieshaowenii]QCA28697.1 UDP-N-acetylmuramyl-tripeptide synthetase [Vagococcus xieshaowenii]TFZ40494.1 UDP-N-acetylmuramyl-tripeptide synthetase [Vagococcus xieshaowenii]